MSLAPMPLRRRVTLAYTALGLVLSLLFACAALLVTEDYEHVLVEEFLRGQAADYSLRLAADAQTPMPQTQRLSGYLLRPDGSGQLPRRFASLAPGFHESENEAVDGIHIGVFDTDQGRLVFVIDLSDIERLERRLVILLVAMFVLGSLVAGWLGWLFAGRTVAPVGGLADAVDALPTRPQPTQLAAAMGNDELGRLAGAIDRYQARLLEADAAERRFFADASHELRTPISVVRGVAEVLLDEPDPPPGMQQRLHRLERGMLELTDLLDVMLGLARRRELQHAPVSVRELLHEACAPYMQAGEGSAVQVDIEVDGMLDVPRHESLLVLRSVVRRMVPPGSQGRLLVGRSGNALTLAFASTMANAPAATASSPGSDRGLALTLILRLVERLGWRLEQGGPASAPQSLLIQLPSHAWPMAG